MVFTFAPRTPALMMMFAAGKLFPRVRPRPGHRAGRPWPPQGCRAEIAGARCARTERVVSGFYTSQAMEARLA
jgi:magnesium-protoporphyrin O-methyltransferase